MNELMVLAVQSIDSTELNRKIHGKEKSSIRRHGYHAEANHLNYYGIWFRRLSYVDKFLPNWRICLFFFLFSFKKRGKT
jgi:hypothetical protein